MKYMRKTPVEAIQWTGDNQREVYDFMNKTARTCCNAADSSGNLIMFWKDFARRKFKAVVPKFGWVVRDGNAFQFYKNTTFHKTFEEVPDDEHKEVMDAIYKECENHVNKIREDINAAIEKRHLMFGKYNDLINQDGRLFKMIDDLYKDDDKTREEVKKQLSEGLKEMEGSDTNKATFESVLDEMKELHAKKNKDYNESFHNLFKEYGMSYALGHIEEKLNRVKAIIANGGNAVKNEHVEDSLIDGACYNILTLIELRNRKH